MTPAVPRFLSAASSDTGPVRANNEDRVYTDDARGIFMVVDGVGGNEAGEHAAEIAVETIRLRLERQTDSVEHRLREAITLANNAIFTAAAENPAWAGMACVLTVAVVQDGQVTIGHVGDSRLYRIRRGRLEKITHDHSPVGEREDSGELSEAEAMSHPRRNEVFRDVGSEKHAPYDPEFIEIQQIPYESDSALLLCSDGVSDALPSAEILAIVQQHAGDRVTGVKALVAAAAERGHDNISAVLVEGPEFTRFAAPLAAPPAVIAAAPPRRARPDFLAYGAIAGALLTFGVMTFLKPAPPPPPPQMISVTPPGTISAALDQARPGDTIQVGPGAYHEAVNLKNGVNLIAVPAREATIEGSVMAREVRGARFEGFLIRNTDIGLRSIDSDLTISRIDVSGATTAGLEFTGAARGSLTASNIHGNAGPGIVILDSAAPEIENNVIVANGTQQAHLAPGVLIRSSAKPRLAGNHFDKNGAEPIWLPAADETAILANFFPADRRPKFKLIAPVQGGGR